MLSFSTAAAVGWFFAALVYYSGRVIYAWRRKRRYAQVFHGSYLRRLMQDPEGRERICEAFEDVRLRGVGNWHWRGYHFSVGAVKSRIRKRKNQDQPIE